MCVRRLRYRCPNLGSDRTANRHQLIRDRLYSRSRLGSPQGTAEEIEAAVLTKAV